MKVVKKVSVLFQIFNSLKKKEEKKKSWLNSALRSVKSVYSLRCM